LPSNLNGLSVAPTAEVPITSSVSIAVFKNVLKLFFKTFRGTAKVCAKQILNHVVPRIKQP
jgi:hypothetical protein